MDSLLWAEPRETWVQSFHQCVSFPPHWAFLALRGVSLTAASETFLSGALASLLAEHVLWGLQASVVEACGPSSGAAQGLVAPAACGIFTDQRPALRPLRWQAASQPLADQGSPLGGAFNLTQRKVGASRVAQGG